MLNRRTFLNATALTIGSAGLPFSALRAAAANMTEPPAFLKGYERPFADDPRKATLQWFRDAKLGLMMHYGLYSIHGIHPFEQYQKKIPVQDYEKLMTEFTAEKFNADVICDLAVDAQMKYVNMVTKHCDGFCLWDSKQTDFNSVKSAAQRDLVGEMANACRKRGLGFFVFYEHGFEWRHPDGPRRKDFKCGLTEVQYDSRQPGYHYGAEYDLNRYLDYAMAQIRELLTNYGPVAGVWLDGIAVPASGDRKRFRVDELYDMIHTIQPQAIVAYKTGLTGKEDFLAPEIHWKPKPEWPSSGKPVEYCAPLNPHWAYVNNVPHKDIDWVMKQLGKCANESANLALNIGPMPNGAVHPLDATTLRTLGQRLRKDGFPKKATALINNARSEHS